MRAWRGKRFSVLVEDGYEIADTPDAVAIVPIDRDGRIVLVRQPRPATGTSVLELPAGLIDGDEEPLDTARRELREETGLRGGSWRELTSFWTSPGFVNERVTVFLAEELDEGEPEPDDDEQLEVVRWDPLALEEGLRELEDATTMIGLLLYLRSR